MRTPLNGIIGYSEMVLDSNRLKLDKKYARQILHESDYLLKLITELLDIGKIEAGKVELEEKSFNLFELLDYVVLNYRKKAIEKGLRLKKTVSQKAA